MTKWQKIAAARGCAWVERKKVKSYHSYAFVLVVGVFWLAIVSIAASALGSVLGSAYGQPLFWIALTAGIGAMALWVRKQRDILISANLGPHEGEGAFIVRLPFVFSQGLTSAKTGQINCPTYCISCGVAETPYHRGGFEFSNISPADPRGKISTKAKLHRGRKLYTIDVTYQIPICDSCIKTSSSANFVHLTVTDGGTFGTDFQFFAFARPAGMTAPSEYAVRFRQQNPSACYICSYCGEPVGDDVQKCKCGKQQPSRQIPLAQAKAF